MSERYENLKRAWAAATDTTSGLRLALATAAVSHPKWRPALRPFLAMASVRARLWVNLRCGGGSLRACVRLHELDADLQGLREVVFQDCYRLGALGKPEVVIDGGANVGFFTLIAAERWPKARLVAVEPLPENAGMVEEHMRANAFESEIVRACLGGRVGVCTFYRRMANRGSMFEDAPYGESFEVPVATLSTLRSQAGPGACLVKLDVEGAELDVLREFLASPQPRCTVVGELHRWPEHQAEFEEILGRARFSVEYHSRDAVCVLFVARSHE